ncbi:hypothetical protein Xcel_0075 [Xylanimonas cellulosilytica DSM 15894]|uniref:Antitoxin FitA-like ribbon-helix-helix domain-containing protein n=1 Tax=Xylanimonas cellulosilytica (strain DSM 15894 / JCM 12276 / CECT 5975 / KCTC 9989 / LMG 20990 / NBRC 107835 / XIL07) TaxID=446471 RepID=D1BTV2_XYLCX|nr:hypothetical protein [Xylanimonas cellulosilytica]ACZ29116.1 hypothetical protein Xcel_0075 [Xylanimonas cellulosilytica DSM 15894]
MTDKTSVDKTITVRGIDEELHRQLKVQAKKHGRSMEAEARAILAAGVRTGVVELTYPDLRVQVDDLTGVFDEHGKERYPHTAGDDWLSRFRRRLIPLWDGDEWDDDWLPEREHAPSPPVVFE